MGMTFPELCERLKDLDEITLIEVLGISSTMLVDMYGDIIEERFDILTKMYEEEDMDETS